MENVEIICLAMREDARRLVAVFQELIDLSEEDTRRANAAREEAFRMGDAFRSLIEDRLAGKGLDRDSMMDNMRSRMSSIHDMADRAHRREMLLLDAHECLMHLYADPGSRDNVNRVFSLLRDLRALSTSHFPAGADVPVYQQPETDDPNRTQSLKSVLEWEGKMSERVLGRQQKWDELFAKSDDILAQCLAAAKEVSGE